MRDIKFRGKTGTTEGWEYQKEIQEIYGIEDLKYLEEKVNKLNKEREEK